MKKQKRYAAVIGVAILLAGTSVAFAEGTATAGASVDANVNVGVQGGPVNPPPAPGALNGLRGDINGLRKDNLDLRKDNQDMRVEFRDEHKDSTPEDRKADRAEMKGKIEANRAEIKDNRGDIEDKRAELKNEVQLKLHVRFNAMIDRLSKIADRIQSGIDAAKAAGSDTVKAQADLDIAVASIADVKVKASAVVVSDTDDQATKDANKAAVDEVKALMKTTKDQLLTATYDLKVLKK